MSQDGAAFISGLQSAGVVAVAKHFPGLGNSSGNTDVAPASTPPWSVEEGAALAPFKTAIANQVPAIMGSNASTPGLSPLPATISPLTETGILRDRLGFDGLVETDSLSAGSLSQIGYSVPQASVAAIRAGADMVIFSSAPSVTTQIIAAVSAAASAGTLPRSRLVDAALHVLGAKGELCGALSSWKAAVAPGGGYWIASSQGNVQAFNAGWFGSPAASRSNLQSPVTAIVSSPDGRGYLLATAGGNVYNFGDARWFGSPTASKTVLPSRVVSMAITPDAAGYWLVTATGNVYNFGDAHWYGSPVASGIASPSPIVAMAPMANGKGYWLASATGNVYNYGSAPWQGSPVADGASLLNLIVSMSPSPNGGYLLLTEAGNVYNFGAVWSGSPAASKMNGDAPFVAIAVPSGAGLNAGYSAISVAPSQNAPASLAIHY